MWVWLLCFESLLFSWLLFFLQHTNLMHTVLVRTKTPSDHTLRDSPPPLQCKKCPCERGGGRNPARSHARGATMRALNKLTNKGLVVTSFLRQSPTRNHFVVASLFLNKAKLTLCNFFFFLTAASDHSPPFTAVNTTTQSAVNSAQFQIKAIPCTSPHLSYCVECEHSSHRICQMNSLCQGVSEQRHTIMSNSLSLRFPFQFPFICEIASSSCGDT